MSRSSRTVRNLRAHVSVIAELASLLSLQVGVDARLEETELEIEGVRAKLLLKVRLDDNRAILREALQTVAEHPQILRILTRALDELVTERIGDALGTLQSALGDLEGDGPVEEETLRGKLEDARDTFQNVLDELGDQGQGERFARGGVPEVASTSAAEEPQELQRKGGLRILADRTGVDSCATLPSQNYVERGGRRPAPHSRRKGIGTHG
jgi:hypothetical protein